MALSLKLGAESAVDGHYGKVTESAREFAPNGFDAALITVRGQDPEAIKTTENALISMREGGRVAYPWTDNLLPAPKAPSTVRLFGFIGNLNRASITTLNQLIESGAFEVHLGRTFTLDQAVDAFRAVGSHHLGRIALLLNSQSQMEEV